VCDRAVRQVLGQAIEHSLERQELGPRCIDSRLLPKAQSAREPKLEGQLAR